MNDHLYVTLNVIQNSLKFYKWEVACITQTAFLLGISIWFLFNTRDREAKTQIIPNHTYPHLTKRKHTKLKIWKENQTILCDENVEDHV